MASFGGGAAAAERGITSPGILFYLIAPVKHSTLEDVPPYVTQAVPWFFAMIFGELLVSALQGRKTLARRHNLKEALCSISLGILSQVWGIPIAAAGLRAYCYLYANYALWKLPPDDSYLCWGLGLLGVDFAYYVFHRFSHEFHLFWMGHSVHHSGEFYNVATALRQSALSTPGSSIVYLPLAVLGLPPPAFLTHKALNLLYQYWIHTETIGDLGPLEYILNTPSHHRVHHRPGGEANYAGVLIIWDRFFGTFRAEGEKQVDRYGLGRPLGTFDPIYANFCHADRVLPTIGWSFIFRRRLVRQWRVSLRELIKPLPSNRMGVFSSGPAEAVEGEPLSTNETLTAKWRRDKYYGSQPPTSSGRGLIEAIYIVLQTLIALGVYFGFEGRLKKHGAYDPTVYLLGVWVCLTLCSLGRLADGDKSGRKLEWARLLMLLPAALAVHETDKRPLVGAASLVALWAGVGRGWWWVAPKAAKSE